MDMNNTGNPPLLEIVRLDKHIGPVQILHDINLSLFRGDLLGLIGPNGAGKTTLIRCITDQLLVDPGQVMIDGEDLLLNPVDAKQEIGYALEPQRLPIQLTGRQFIELVASARGSTSYEEEVTKLTTLFDSSGYLDDEIGTYSTGMRQKVSITAALAGGPSLIILDESLNGLDPVSAYRLKQYLRQQVASGTVGVLLASHMLTSIEKYCTRVVVLHEGRVRKQWTQAALQAEMQSTGRDLEEVFIDLIGAYE